ncbi:DNA-binding protein [Rhizobium leguminosarum]|uniref:DNA-binding protein n=1 Tax=Rhizobium leguminosarum TaxID=384 RepID=UPI0010317A82|nr:DNA-binding protein [Rhizobium leguminosarum]TBG03779.1 DNA-binding protein [Rhizobium leguminosarum]
MAETTEALDLLWGAAEIAHVIGKTPRATFHLLEGGELPAKKVKGRWVADRSTLTAFFRGVGDNAGAA